MASPAAVGLDFATGSGPKAHDDECEAAVELLLWKRLGEVDLLSALPEDTLRRIAQAGAVFSHGPGHVLIRKGDPAPGLRVVMEGSARVDVDGVVRRPLEVGDYFGEISLLDQKSASASVIAGDDGLKAFAISPLTFNELLDADPHMARTILVTMCTRLRSAEQQVRDSAH